MRGLGIIIAAVAALSLGAMPLEAMAAQAKITSKQRDAGKAGAPAALSLAQVTCTMTDAYEIQSGTDPKTKAKTVLYEAACAEGPGYFVQIEGEKANAFPCLAQEETAKRDEAAGKKGTLLCQLEGNTEAKAGYGKLLTGMGMPCTATNARLMGMTAAGDTFIETACEGDKGYVIQTSLGKPAQASDCIQSLGAGGTECTLTTKEQIFANMTRMTAPSGKNCTVNNARMVGADRATGSVYYEVACGAAGGYMIKASNTGAFQEAIECGKAQNIAGGCELTVIDQTAEAGTYTKLAQGAGFPCEVSRYRYIGKEPRSNSEIVELACTNRPDGGIGLFPISGGKSQVFDCVRGGFVQGVSCQLTPANLVYPEYTKRLAAMGKTQCQVSGAKFLASTETGSDFIETACSDGLPGFVISMDHSTGATKELLTCGQVSRAGAACTLPTNTRKQ